MNNDEPELPNFKYQLRAPNWLFSVNEARKNFKTLFTCLNKRVHLGAQSRKKAVEEINRVVLVEDSSSD